MFIPPGEKIVETKKCRISGKEFVITDGDLKFYDQISPILNGTKYLIPSPNLCPDERQRRRLVFRNENNLYKRMCALTGREIISMYSPESEKIVYDHEVWWSDAWDVSQYQGEFDFSRPFFDQFRDFIAPIPVPGLYNSKNENSRFSNYIIGGKNCYMSAVVYYGCENILYSRWIFEAKDIVDSFLVYNSEKCHGCIHIKNCNNCRNLIDCNNCSDCLYGKYLIGCRDCLLCSSLSQKQYCILNKQYTKEEYEQKKSEFLQLSAKVIEKYFSDFLGKQIAYDLYNFKCENCMGDSMLNCKDSFYCFDAEELENCKHIRGERMKNCMDGIGGQIDNSYEFNRGGIIGTSCCFVNDAINSSNVFYCSGVYNVSDCFGCSGLHSHEHHCVLNIPYSTHEYETLCAKIIDHMRSTGEWGEFFPHTMSPFGYNESSAQDYFSMTEIDVKEKGWNWYIEEIKRFEGAVCIPLSIKEHDERIVGHIVAQKNIDDILAGVVQCEVTGKPFKIVKQELLFYIQNSIPIPTKHPDQRHKERMALRNPQTFYERKCAECQKDIITTYAPERPEKVVCEDCYRKLVY